MSLMGDYGDGFVVKSYQTVVVYDGGVAAGSRIYSIAEVVF